MKFLQPHFSWHCHTSLFFLFIPPILLVTFPQPHPSCNWHTLAFFYSFNQYYLKRFHHHHPSCHYDTSTLFPLILIRTCNKPWGSHLMQWHCFSHSLYWFFHYHSEHASILILYAIWDPFILLCLFHQYYLELTPSLIHNAIWVWGRLPLDWKTLMNNLNYESSLPYLQINIPLVEFLFLMFISSILC